MGRRWRPAGAVEPGVPLQDSGDDLRRVACAVGTCGRRAWPECQYPGARGLWARVCVSGGVGLYRDTLDCGVPGGPPWTPETGAWEALPRCLLNEQLDEFYKRYECVRWRRLDPEGGCLTKGSPEV